MLLLELLRLSKLSGGRGKWSEYSTLVQRVPGSKLSSDLSQRPKSKERICQLSVAPGKKAEEITRCGQIERLQITLPIQWALCALHMINPYLTKIVSLFAYQLSNALLGLVYLFSGPFVLCAYSQVQNKYKPIKAM